MIPLMRSAEMRKAPRLLSRETVILFSLRAETL